MAHAENYFSHVASRPTAYLAMTLNFRTTSRLSVHFLCVILLSLKGTAHPAH